MLVMEGAPDIQNGTPLQTFQKRTKFLCGVVFLLCASQKKPGKEKRERNEKKTSVLWMFLVGLGFSFTLCVFGVLHLGSGCRKLGQIGMEGAWL